MTAPRLTLGVVGAGRAASALVPRWRAAGHAIAWQQHRDDTTTLAARPPVDVIVVAVRDGDIADIVNELGDRATASGEIWLHLSGSLPGSLARLDATRPRAAGCLHPLMALAGASGLTPLDAVAGLDGDALAIEAATTLAIAAGLTPRAINAANKALYHAAAVTVAGHATALFAQAMRLMQGAGMSADDARLALAPLMRSAAVNLLDAPPEAAITGPIARGDAATVAAHLAALRTLGDVQAEAAYRILAREALALSEASLSADAVSAIAAIVAASDETA